MKREIYEVSCTAFIFVKVHAIQMGMNSSFNHCYSVSEDMKLFFSEMLSYMINKII